MPLLKYLTLAVCLVAPASAMGITRRLDGSACANEPDAILPGGWDCARIAELQHVHRRRRPKEDQYAPVTRAISEEDLVAPEEDVERGPTLEDKRRMLD